MRLIQYAAGIAAASILSIQPCLAADHFAGSGMAERRSAAFAGARIKLPLGARNPERPSLRLQATSFHDYRDATGATVRSYRSPGIEIGFSKAGNASYFVGGQDVAQTPERLHAGGSTKWIIIGGVVVAVLLLAAVASAAPTPGPDEGAFD